MINICASITEIESEKFSKLAAQAFDMGASFLEIRFDYVESRKFSESLAVVQPFKSKCVYTLRRTNQGGKFDGSEIQRLKYLQDLACQLPMMIDVEYETLQEYPEIGTLIKSLDLPMLLSWHDFKSTPSEVELAEVLGRLSSFSNNNKLVTTANSLEDTLRVLNLYEIVDESVNLVAFCMGEIGLVSRMLCALHPRCPFTYAAIDRPVAPGQLTIEQMKKLYRMVTRDNPLDGG
jgi:3-dehydroquinate dehydratase-1